MNRYTEVVVSDTAWGISLYGCFDRQKSQMQTLLTWESWEEAAEYTREVNEQGAIKSHWPVATDPDVQMLIDNPDFDPVKDDRFEEGGSSRMYLAQEAVARKRANVG